MNVNVGNNGRDLNQGNNNEFIDVYLQVILRYLNRDIRILVGNIFLEFRNFMIVNINL